MKIICRAGPWAEQSVPARGRLQRYIDHRDDNLPVPRPDRLPHPIGRRFPPPPPRNTIYPYVAKPNERGGDTSVVASAVVVKVHYRPRDTRENVVSGKNVDLLPFGYSRQRGWRKLLRRRAETCPTQSVHTFAEPDELDYSRVPI